MREQNQPAEGRFTIQKFSGKGPFYLQPHQRVATLQNKVTFYEGQLDPLHCENSHIKQNHINLSRIVSISTDILRNLLPANSPAKKLRLEMATIDEVAKMIEADWKDMEQAIAGLLAEKKQMGEEISQWKEKLRREEERRVREVEQLSSGMQQLKSQYGTQVQGLQRELAKTKAELENYKEQAANEQALRDKIIDSCNRELQIYRYESKCKYNDYERCIGRLNAQMESNLAEFEQGKKMVKLICQKMMNDKLAELAQAYEMMLKAKEEEKFILQLNINDLTEEHGIKLKQKDDQIQALTIRNEAKAAEIKRLEDELYTKKEELTREIKENKELQTQLLRANEKSQALLERVRKQETTIQQQVEKIKATIEEYEQDLKVLKEKGSQALNKVIQQKNHLQKEMQEKESQLKAVKQSLTTVQEQWRYKIENAQKNWLQKQSQYTAQIAKNVKRIEQQKQKVIRMKQERDKQIQRMGKDHQQLLRRLQTKFQQSKQAYMREQTIKMRKMMDENEDEIVRIKLNYKKQLEAQMGKMEEEIKKRSIQLQLRLAQNEKKFELQRKKYEAQIQTIKAQEQLLSEKLAKAKQEVLQYESQMQKLKIQQIKALKKLQLQNELNDKKWSQMMQHQMQQFLKELQIKQQKISTLRQQFNQERQQFQKKLINKDAELVSMKESMQKQINSLKDTNGMMEMENKYKSELALLEHNLKARLLETEENYKQRINSLNDLHEKAVRSLIEDYDQKIVDTHHAFQKTLIGLGSQFQSKSTFYNDKYLAEEIDAKLQNLSQQQKIEFIRGKMEQTIGLLLERDNQIATMQLKLQRFQKKIEEEMEIRRKQLQAEKQSLINSCNGKIWKKEEQCRQRVEAVEQERKAFSEQLFRQFHLMKENHMNQFNSLQRKYRELEEMFSVRPSRPEDVTKIKELINIQTKLDKDITIYHKKMETANEIVKYLNLQLENYKETYDIFGPHEAAGGVNNKTISFTDDSHKMIDLYKQREQERAKEERQVIHLDRRNVESPDVKQLRIFAEKDEEHSESIIFEPKEAMGRSRKYSLVPEKSQLPRDRFKTEKIADRQSQLMGHAQTFMRLIKKTSQDVSIIRELQSNQDVKKKTYRRRKLKRLTTGLVEHYF